MTTQPDAQPNVLGPDLPGPDGLGSLPGIVPSEIEDAPPLTPDAARAVDRVLNEHLLGQNHASVSRPDAPHTDEEASSPETAALHALLTTLDHTPPENTGVLADLIELRARRIDDAIARADAHLSAHDADALDAWLLHKGDAGRTPRALRERAHRHAAIADTVSASAPSLRSDARNSLIERTMERVREADASDRPLTLSDRAVPPGRGSFRWSDLGAIAAVLVVAGALLRPSMDAVGSYQQDQACFGAMGSVAQAMGQYQNDFGGLLPVATGTFGGSWWDVGTTPDRSNAANLFMLKSAGYATLNDLACPGNAHAAHREEQVVSHDWRTLEQVSFSYRLPGLTENGRLRFDAGSDPARAVVIADRSPVVLRAVARQTIRPYDNSPNHDGRGQRLLFADGSVTHATSPVLETGDNIWLPNTLERAIHRAARNAGLDLEGRELPASADDVFLGP